MTQPEPAERILEQEQAVRALIEARLSPVDVVRGDQQEMIAYRLSEIFVAARSLYTDILPRFLEDERGGEDAVFEGFGEVRMHLLQMRDLIADFEEAFLESLTEHQETVAAQERSLVDEEQKAEEAEEEDEEDDDGDDGEEDGPGGAPPVP